MALQKVERVKDPLQFGKVRRGRATGSGVCRGVVRAGPETGQSAGDGAGVEGDRGMGRQVAVL
ncbi:hypothetical protein, partial [Streptomyces scabiei]|uniref:hypothetical protein n=1 Tax=Streptomyces scabiei TaxID=1930 RepID=UPI001F365298